MPTRPDRTRLLLTAYAVGVLVILLMPGAGLASWVVLRTSEVMLRVGLPVAIALTSRVEFALNAAMFAPITFLGAWLWPRVRWSEWLAWAFLGSAFVELFQGLFLPGRSAQHPDVVANTLGGLAGALAALALRRFLTVRSRKSTEPTD